LDKTPDFTEVIEVAKVASLEKVTIDNMMDMYNLAIKRGPIFDLFSGTHILNAFKIALVKAKRCTVEQSEDEFV
jgi:hypothetical protein